LQVNIQNRATGTNATADLVITANNGTDSSNFINLGINNSGYSDINFTNGVGYDGYLFINGGDLDIGTQTPGKNIEFHVGGTTANKTIARMTSDGLTVSGNAIITGHLSAASKSFLITHPLNSNKKLQYGSLESPYHGIRLTDKNKISSESVKIYLPEYIYALVDDAKVNVQLTNINHNKILFVKDINVNENNFTVGMNRGWLDKNEYEFYWSFTAERKDIPKLTVEF